METNTRKYHYRLSIAHLISYSQTLFLYFLPLTSQEILSYLISYEHHDSWISTEVPDR